MTCKVCSLTLTGRQTAFCSRSCAIKGYGNERRDSGRLRKDAQTPEQYAAKLANNARDRAKNRRRYYEQVKCLGCGKEFESKHTKTTCLECAARLGVSFSSCTDIVRWTRPRIYIPTQTTGANFYMSGNCRVCGQGFTSRVWSRTCSVRCHKRWKNSHRVSAKSKKWITSKNRYAIYARDNWACQICHDPVDQSLVWSADVYEPMIASLDHIVPRSHGGTDHPDNLRLTHHLCNSVRGNRVEG